MNDELNRLQLLLLVPLQVRRRMASVRIQNGPRADLTYKEQS
jgi:hypothetical protein